MSSKNEKRSLREDLIDDIVESSQPPSSSSNHLISPFLIDNSKIPQNRNHLSLPLLFNKPKFDSTNKPIITFGHNPRDCPHLSSPRGHASSLIRSNDERRREIDLIIKHLYDGKLLTTTNDDHTVSDISEPPTQISHRGAITLRTMAKRDEEGKNNDLHSLDGDITSLQRELKEKELDITHLHKEIQELQLENKLLKARGPSVFSNGYTNNENDSDALRREKDILKNELSLAQEIIAKFQQKHHNLLIKSSNRIDEITFHQQETFENKIRCYEQRMRMLAMENDKFKQTYHQFEQIVSQLKKENDELQQKVSEGKKRNDELFYQEFHSLRNNLKELKKRNNDLFQENLCLQQGQKILVRRSSTPGKRQFQSPSHLQGSNLDSKHSRMRRSDSPNMSDGSDSTNYLTTVSVDRYNSRPATSVFRSTTVDGNNHHRTMRYNRSKGQDDINPPLSRSFDQQFHFRPSKTKYSTDWSEDIISPNEADIINYVDDHPTRDTANDAQFFQSSYPGHRRTTSIGSQHGTRRSIHSDTNSQSDDHRPTQGNTPMLSPRRPYAPSSINDIHLTDVIKFARPGGKVSKGLVKYIGLLPGKTEQYLGLELEDEESKHDGTYQDQRLFQCKANKGVFVGFNKVIMAWSGQ